MVKRFLGGIFFCILYCIGTVDLLCESFLAYQSKEVIERNRQFIEQHPLLGEEDKNNLLGNFMLARFGIVPTALALSPDGIYFAASEMSSSGVGRLFIAPMNRLERSFERKLPGFCIKDICFSHDNHYFALAINDLSNCQNNKVQIWETKSFLNNPAQSEPVKELLIGAGERVKIALSSTGDYLAVSLSATPLTSGKITFYNLRNLQKNWAKKPKFCSILLPKGAECTGWSFTQNDRYLVANIAKKGKKYELYFYEVAKIVHSSYWNPALCNSYDDRSIISLATLLGEQNSFVCPMSAGYFDKPIVLCSTSSQSSFFAFRGYDSPYTWVYASFIKTFPHEYLKRLVDLYVDDRLTLDNHFEYDEKKLYETMLNDALPTRLRKNYR